MSEDASKFSDETWIRSCRAIRDFENRWNAGERPVIEDYLAGFGPGREPLKLELVHAELEFRIKAGEPARVEEYLERFPALVDDDEAVLGLIQAECDCRGRAEVELTLESYRKRFPRLAANLIPTSAEAPTLRGPGHPLRPDPGSTVEEDEALPRMLGKYEIRERVGRGTFGIVYRGWDTVLKWPVAVKVSLLEKVATTEELGDLLREGRNAIRLKHPNIVSIRDGGTIEGVSFLIREYVDGETLADLLARGPMPLDEAVALMVEVASALDYAHQSGIAHRDLKPSNILIDRRGRPMVADFGLARRISGEKSSLSAGTGVQLYVGTPAYMSPEQARGQGRAVDARSDVFTAGVVLYQMITGEVPFRKKGLFLLMEIQKEKPEAPRSIRSEIPRALEAVVLKAMAKKPEDRHASAAELAAALATVLEQLRSAPPRQPPKSTPELLRAKLGASLIANVVLAVALGAAVALWLPAERHRRSHAGSKDAAGAELRAIWAVEIDPALDGPATHRLFRDRIEAGHGRLARMEDSDPGRARARAVERFWQAERALARGSDRASAEACALALVAVEAAAQADPGELGRLRDRARCLSGLAGSHRALSGATAAGSFATLAEQAWQALGDVEGIQAGSMASPGDVDARLDRDEAILEAARAARIAGRIPDLARADPIPIPEAGLARLDLAQGRRHARHLVDLAAWQLEAGRAGPAIDGLSRALAIARSGPGGPDRLALEARAVSGLGAAFSVLDRRDRAMEHHREAFDILSALVLADPANPEHRRALAAAEFRIARISDLSKVPEAAIAGYRRSISGLRSLRDVEPDRHGDLADRSRIRQALACAEAREGRPVLAATSLVLAMADSLRSRLLAPGEPGYHSDLRDRARCLGRIVRASAGLDWKSTSSGPGTPQGP